MMMNQLEERLEYEDDEIDLTELLHTLLKHKIMIAATTICITGIATIGGYIYNRANTVSSAIIGFNYPELQRGKNPDGSPFVRSDIIPLSVINEVYEEYKNEIDEKTLDDFRSSIRIEPIVPKATQNLIDSALEKGETVSFTASNYEIVSEDRNKDILNKIVNDSIAKYIARYKPSYTIPKVEKDVYNYDYDDSYVLLSERISMLEMAISSYDTKSYMSNRLGYSFEMLNERIKNFANVELQYYYSYYTINGISKNKNDSLIRIDSKINELLLENEGLEGKSKVVGKMLEDLKPTQNQIVIPNVANGVSIKDQNDYYYKLITDYVELNNEIEDNKVRIKLLEDSKLDIKSPSIKDEEILDRKLKNSVDKLNRIIADTNRLTDEYIDSSYSDMIKLVSPVTLVTEGKPLILFTGVGAALGIVLGVLLAFIKEFTKNYKKKYN